MPSGAEYPAQAVGVAHSLKKRPNEVSLENHSIPERTRRESVGIECTAPSVSWENVSIT